MERPWGQHRRPCHIYLRLDPPLTLGLDATGSTPGTGEGMASATYTLTFAHGDQSGRIITISGNWSAAANTATITDTRSAPAKLTAADLSGSMNNLVIRNVTQPAVGSPAINETDMWGDVSCKLDVADSGSGGDTDTVPVTAYALIDFVFDYDGTGGTNSTHDPLVAYSTTGTSTAHIPSFDWGGGLVDKALVPSRAAIGSTGTCTVELFAAAVDLVRMDGDGVSGAFAASDLIHCRTIEVQSNPLIDDIEPPPMLRKLWAQACGLTGSIDMSACAANITDLYLYINDLAVISDVASMVNVVDFRAQSNTMTTAEVDAIITALAGRSSPVAGTTLDLSGAGGTANGAATAGANLTTVQGQFTTVNVN